MRQVAGPVIGEPHHGAEDAGGKDIGQRSQVPYIQVPLVVQYIVVHIVRLLVVLYRNIIAVVDRPNGIPYPDVQVAGHNDIGDSALKTGAFYGNTR